MGARVLIVDDKPEFLGAAAALFRMSGLEALSAGDGMAAIQILERTAGIKLLLSDVLMPRMDGVTLGREARKLVPGIKGYSCPDFRPVQWRPTKAKPGSSSYFSSRS